MPDLERRRVLVTGASAGIGAATARALAARGAKVACLARREDRITALAAEIGGIAVRCDITDHVAVARAVSTAADGLGGLDGLVNNAGIARPGLIADTTYDDWRLMFEVNVLGLLSATQAALQHLRAAGAEGPADIVNISSLAGRRVPPRADAGVYSATKHAVHVLTRSLRQELAGSGIRVSVVAPGIVDTDIGADHPHPAIRERYARQQAQVGISADEVGSAVARVLAAPRGVNVYEIAVLPTDQAM